MAIVLRIILSLIVGWIFVWVIFSTFFLAPNYLSVPEFKLLEDVWIDSKKNIISVSDFATLYIDEKSITPEVKFSSWTYNTSVEVPWKYFSSFRWISEKYSFSGTWFSISQEWWGDVYIDTLTVPWKVFLYSVNVPVTLSLLNENSSEKYVDVHLTPHMYIEFQANRGKYLKNADRIRIETVFKLGYIGSLSDKWKDTLISDKYLKSEDMFFSDVLTKINANSSELEKQITNFSLQEVSQISWYDIIQRYTSLFINDDKKLIFYKNKVLEGYLKIFQTEKEDKKIVSQINRDLESIKKLDRKSYEELLTLQVSIMKAIYSSSRENFIIAKILFSNLLDEKLASESLYFSLYGFSLFNKYDQTHIFSHSLSASFLEYFSIYVESRELWAENSKRRYDYFLFYLEKQLLYLLNTQDVSKNIVPIMTTLENYISINTRDEEYTTTARISRLFVLADIFKKIDLFLRSEYFLADRTLAGTLTLETTKKILAENVVAFRNNINDLYEIYEADVWFLNESNSREKIDEDFLALEKYEKYISQYDISKTSLLSLDTFSQNEDDNLSLDKVNSYLSKFIGISFLNASISIEDNSYYHVENLNISGKVFSFDLYPAPEYKMSNIYADEIAKPIQYKLWNIEYDWGEKYKVAIEEEKNLFDFSRFFLLTFFAKNDPSIEEYVTTTIVQEDKTEVVFKKDILLWNPWEFTILKDILDIEYKDISLEKVGQDYNIFLSDVVYNTSIFRKSWGNKIYKWILKSEYVLNDSDHYFKGLWIQTYAKHDNIKIGFLLNGKEIFIWWKVHITDLEKTIRAIMQQINVYNSVYNEIVQNIWAENISLQYTFVNNKMSIRFDSLDKKYTILMKDWMIESIYSWASKIKSWDVPLWELTNYIK
jgi:hypothetical protein